MYIRRVLRIYDETQKKSCRSELGRHARNASMNVQQKSTEGTNSSKLQDTEDTRLHGRWLVLARVVWFILVALALLVFIFSLPVYIAQLYGVCTVNECGTGQLTPQIVETLRNLGFSIGEYVTINVVLAFVQAFVWFIVGGVLFR